MRWSGDPPASAIGSFERQYIPAVAVNETGPWALFRLIDKYAVAADAPQGRAVLEVRNPFHSAEIVLEPPSARTSPFDKGWRQFSCDVS
jgi:type VI protein secretion system component VasK